MGSVKIAKIKCLLKIPVIQYLFLTYGGEVIKCCHSNSQYTFHIFKRKHCQKIAMTKMK